MVMIVCDDVEYRGTAMDYSEETQEVIMNFVFLEGVVASNIIPRDPSSNPGATWTTRLSLHSLVASAGGSARPQGKGKRKVLQKLYSCLTLV